MASIHKEAIIDASADLVWDAMRDVGELHRRLVPGFVTGCRMDGESRIVTFGNGLVAREVIIDVDNARRRLVWSAKSERLEHHNASAQVIDDGLARCRVVWIADVLPHAAAQVVGAMMDQGLASMSRTLSSHSRPA